MDWDLGLQGLLLLGLISLGFGLVAGLLVGGGAVRRLGAVLFVVLACFVTGLVTSEMIFGWASGEELQPNIDGLSRDEVLLSSLLTTVVIVLVVRYAASRAAGRGSQHAKHVGDHRRAGAGHRARTDV